MRFVLAFLIAFACVPAEAGWFQHGNSNWFQWHDAGGRHDGFWYLRSHNGHGYVYQKTEHAIAEPFIAQRQSIYGDALSRLLKIEVERQRYLTESQVAAQEYNQFLGVLKTLRGNGGNGLDYEQFGLRDFGDTVYGPTPTYKQLANPRFDVNAAITRFLALNEQQSNGIRLTTQETADLIKLAAEAEQHIQALERRGEINAETMKQLKLLLDGVLEKKTPKGPPVVPQSPGQPVLPEQPGGPGDPGAAIPENGGAGDFDALVKAGTSVVTARCVECHSGTKKSGGLDLSGDLLSLSPEAKKKVRERLITLDPKLRMPQGGTLTDEEHRALWPLVAE